jgi:hypothetical protein
MFYLTGFYETRISPGTLRWGHVCWMRPKSIMKYGKYRHKLIYTLIENMTPWVNFRDLLSDFYEKLFRMIICVNIMMSVTVIISYWETEKIFRRETLL